MWWCYLSDAFRMVVGDSETRDLSNLATRTILKFTALSTPLPWPRGVKTLPEADQELGGTPPSEFTADVTQLKALMERFTALEPGAFTPHPIFGAMTRGEWGRWGYRHVDHHLRQFGQ